MSAKLLARFGLSGAAGRGSSGTVRRQSRATRSPRSIFMQDLKDGLGGKADAAAAETWANKRIDRRTGRIWTTARFLYIRAGVQISSEEREMMRSDGARMQACGRPWRRAAMMAADAPVSLPVCRHKGILCRKCRASDLARHPVKIVLLAGGRERKRPGFDLARSRGGLVVDADRCKLCRAPRFDGATVAGGQSSRPHRPLWACSAGSRSSVGARSTMYRRPRRSAAAVLDADRRRRHRPTSRR